jgi:hypothetical protein
VIRATGDEAKVACSNVQLCAGLEAGIEGAVHAVRISREERQAALRAERMAEEEGRAREPPDARQASAEGDGERR